jgi:hypothetical protein
MAGEGPPSTTVPHATRKVVDAGLRRHDEVGIADESPIGPLVLAPAHECFRIRIGESSQHAAGPIAVLCLDADAINYSRWRITDCHDVIPTGRPKSSRHRMENP